MTQTTETLPSHVRLAVPLEDMRRLKPFISTEETRYYLQGVHFETGGEGTLLVATDGHRLGVYKSDRAICASAGTVRVPAYIKRAVKKKELWFVVGTFAGAELSLVLEFPENGKAADIAKLASLSDALAIYANPVIIGEYPNWRKVIPSKTGTCAGAFNSKYLGSFAQVSPGRTAIAAHGTEPTAPHLIEIPGEENFVGVLMPMRHKSIYKIPSWLDAPKAKRARKAA